MENKNIFKDISFEEAIKSKIKFRTKYEQDAINILEAIGGPTNYTKYYKCFTKLRFVFIDKSLIDLKKLNEIKIVKGVTFYENELHIAIGGEVSNLKDALDDHFKKISLEKANFEMKNLENKKNTNLFVKFLEMIKNIVVPIMPFFVISGLLGFVNVILQMTGAISILTPTSNFTDQSIFEIVWFSLVTSTGTFMFFGMFWSGVKYFGGDPVYGIIFAVALFSPVLFRGTISDDGNIVSPFQLTIWETTLPWKDVPTVWLQIGPLYSSFFSVIIGSKLIAYTENSLKKVHPAPFYQFLFLPCILLVVVGFTMMLFFAPLIRLAETFFSEMIALFMYLPVSLGAFFIGCIWPIMTLTGIHMVLSMILTLPWLLNPGQPDISVPIMAVDEMQFISYIGTSLGIYFVTQNEGDKQQIRAGIPLCLLGTKQPLQFGILAPNIKAFGVACLANGFGTWVAVALGTNVYPQGSGGIMTIVKALGPNADINSLLTMFAGQIITFACGFIMIFAIYKFNNNEKAQVQKINKKIEKLYNRKKINFKEQNIINELENNIYVFYDKEKMQIIKEFRKAFQKKQKNEIKLATLISKYDNKIAKLSNKLNKMLELKKYKIEKAKTLFLKLKSLEPDSRIAILEKQNIEFTKNYEEYEKKVNELISELEPKIESILNQVSKDLNDSQIKNLDTYYINAVNHSFVEFKLKEKIKNSINLKKLYLKDRKG